MLQKAQFIGSISALYLLTLGTIGGILYSSHLFGTPVWATPAPAIVQQTPPKLPPQVLSGKPLRIAIPSAGIDLPVTDGTYDSATGSWTLSESGAHYAVMTSLANDHAGTTFIYGHGTDAVFGKIGSNRPPVGTAAIVTTDTGKAFHYSLVATSDTNPSDTSIFNDTTNGAPRLVVQTCTGIFSEWRTMFTFELKEVL